MACARCKSNSHNTTDHFRVVEKIRDKGFPTSAKGYATAHEKADKVEKSTYPKGYQEMKKVDRALPKGQLAGKNTKSGKIEVSKKVPPKLRKEVALHEKVESHNLRKKK